MFFSILLDRLTAPSNYSQVKICQCYPGVFRPIFANANNPQKPKKVVAAVKDEAASKERRVWRFLMHARFSILANASDSLCSAEQCWGLKTRMHGAIARPGSPPEGLQVC